MTRLLMRVGFVTYRTICQEDGPGRHRVSSPAQSKEPVAYLLCCRLPFPNIWKLLGLRSGGPIAHKAWSGRRSSYYSNVVHWFLCRLIESNDRSHREVLYRHLALHELIGQFILPVGQTSRCLSDSAPAKRFLTPTGLLAGYVAYWSYETLPDYLLVSIPPRGRVLVN